MFGTRSTAQVLSENPEAMQVWLVYVSSTLYELRTILGLNSGETSDGQGHFNLDIVRPEDGFPATEPVD